MRQLWTVTKFEFLLFAKNKAFIGITIFLMLTALIGPAAPGIISNISNITATRTIAVVDHTGAFNAEMLSLALSPDAIMFDNIEDAVTSVENGYNNYALELFLDRFYLHTMTIGIGMFTLEHQIASVISQQYIIDNFQAHGIAQDTVFEIIGFSPHREIISLGTGEANDFFENIIYAYVLGIILYMGLMLGGAHLLTTVVREKSTKTMELLVTSCSPTTMLNGKVIGTGAAIMSQILLMVATAIVSISFVPNLFSNVDDLFTLTLNPQIMVYLVLFFLLGFTMYAYIYAALASTTSRQEDATSMSMLPQLLIMAGFFGTMISMNTPTAGWVVAVSHFPLLAPFLMFTRICMGTVATWEIMISITAQILTIVIISFLASKIYRMGTLMYGAKPTFKNLLEAFK